MQEVKGYQQVGQGGSGWQPDGQPMRAVTCRLPLASAGSCTARACSAPPAGCSAQGERNYAKLEGDTGPLVYPAGFVYLFSALRSVTGEAVLRAQARPGGRGAPPRARFFYTAACMDLGRAAGNGSLLALLRLPPSPLQLHLSSL